MSKRWNDHQPIINNKPTTTTNINSARSVFQQLTLLSITLCSVCQSLLVVMQSDRSVVSKHCCVVILFTIVFFCLFSMFQHVLQLLLFYGLRFEINEDDDDDNCIKSQAYTQEVIDSLPSGTLGAPHLHPSESTAIKWSKRSTIPPIISNFVSCTLADNVCD